MARRKRQFLEDDDDSDNSSGSDLDLEADPDLREERALHDDPYQRKRRRKNGKEDALYGVFAEDMETEQSGSKGKVTGKRSDWAKAPAFVSGQGKSKPDEDEDMGNGEDPSSSEEGDEDKDDDIEEDGDSSEDEAKPPSPRVRDEEEEDLPTRPQMGGIGSRKPQAGLGLGFSRGGIGTTSQVDSSTSNASVGPSRGGIGSSRPTPVTSEPIPHPSLPSAFGAGHTQRSFLRDTPSSTPKPPAATPAEMAHFAKLKDTFGARMLEKMGWQAGTGLGPEGTGIVNPVESKLRPDKIGIAFKGFKEKTAASKAHARRLGKEGSSDEDEGGKKRSKKQKADKKPEPAWKRPKKVKTKIQHQTYEQIVAAAGEQPTTAGIGMIIDATGATPREVASLADVSIASWTPSSDATRIPEVRHNLRLIGEACKTDLDGLAREAKALEERKQYIMREDARLRKKVSEEADLIQRLQQVSLVAEEINNQAKQVLASDYEANLESFSPIFYKLLDQFSTEFERYRLDEIVVAAIAPLVRRMVAQWQPLDQPLEFISTFKNWRKALRVNTTEEKPNANTQLDVYGTSTIKSTAPAIEKPMTPFESLLWTVWLPRVRSCLNNEWAPQLPQPAVRLYEAWCTFLPPFIRDNVLDQLILPKVQKAVADWNPRKQGNEKVPLETLVFPWLPHMGLRLEELVGDGKRKVKNLLRGWSVGEEIPVELDAWKGVFEGCDWDAMLLKYVVPKLAATLRDDLIINPRDQNMGPIKNVLLWSRTLRPSIFSPILEAEFFPKWLNTLHLWLIQPKVSFEEVAQWYSFWKSTFPDHVHNMPGVARGFTKGLQLMNKAIELGPDAPTKLPRPDHQDPSNSNTSATAPKQIRPASARTHEITFRSIVEEFAASHDLLLIPTGKTHEKSRMPLFRVSNTVGGNKGLPVYILDDAVWAASPGHVGVGSEDFRAISLEDMAGRAHGA